MNVKVKLTVLSGPMKGRNFVFEEHDTLIFGRAPDCHIQLPETDPSASRHHFLLEVNPPDAVVRDLGSLNGTWVNGQKQGGRDKAETPEDAARRKYPEVNLKDGDQIQVGESVLRVVLDLPANGAKPDARCQHCGREVTAEIGKGRHGDYVCEACRHQAEADPAQLLFALMALAGKVNRERVPEIAGYQIEKRLGVGGFGAVYLARRQRDGNSVAIKVMLSRVAVSEEAREKFLHEMEVNRSLRHPNIVAFLDQGSAGGAFYFVMEYCNGGSVADLMARRGGRLAVPEAGAIALQALEGLAYAHGKQVVHRDLKPPNILLSGSDGNWSAKIGDLGMAKNFQRAGLSGMTLTGSYAGTPHFMPREQVINFKFVKPVSDVWSMGATLYNMLTGQTPRDFPKGRDPMEVVLRDEVVPIRRRSATIPPKVAEVIDRALANDPKSRYPTAAEMKAALERVL